MNKYELVLKALSGDGYSVTTQYADAYAIHPTGFHVFVTGGSIVRSIAGWLVIGIRVLESDNG